MEQTISVARGTIRFPAGLVATYFSGIDAVAVLIDGATLRILPVFHAAAGGALLKQRNAQGDRVVGAFDVFEEHGLADFEAQDVPVRWSSGDAALLADLPVTDN
jgi:hypothetical protein